MHSDDDSDEDEILQKQFKIILLGDGSVGKTSIAKRFSQDSFAPTYKQTVGVDFLVKRLNMPPNHSVTMQLWDIGGQSIGSKMVTKYIAGAHAVLLCYDITNHESFANLEDWYRLVLNTFEGETMPVCALIANKTDLKHVSQVRMDDHLKFCKENSFISFMISAKSGDQIQLAFWKVAAQLIGTPDMTPATGVVLDNIPAIIINSKQHDDNVQGGSVPEYTTKKRCLIS
jgi:Ras-related protein Rab-28